MFIELAEHVRCTEPHEDTFCVLATDEIVDRQIITGTVGCPACSKEYPIVEGVLRCAERIPRDESSEIIADAAAVWALLGIESPGGFVSLIGTAVRYAGALSALMGDVHFVGINGPSDTSISKSLSLVECRDKIPMRDGFCRGVVVGPEYCDDHFLKASARLLLNAQRMVALSGKVKIDEVELVAEGGGMWVGAKSRYRSTSGTDART
ncbi:MAG: hypothetical protein O7D29_12060 [Gemmatimonadetes bacterium]|nr:hypothetical protein [Gemmatimonadota bacterium]